MTRTFADKHPLAVAHGRVKRLNSAKYRGYTDYLFARPSIWQGIGSIADVWGTRWPYNYSDSETEADLRALRCDWVTVGNDLRLAMAVKDDELATEPQLALFGTEANGD